jgi:hypothetical protein
MKTKQGRTDGNSLLLPSVFLYVLLQQTHAVHIKNHIAIIPTRSTYILSHSKTSGATVEYHKSVSNFTENTSCLPNKMFRIAHRNTYTIAFQYLSFFILYTFFPLIRFPTRSTPSCVSFLAL